MSGTLKLNDTTFATESSGNISATVSKLHVQNTNVAFTPDTNTDFLIVENNGNSALQLVASTTDKSEVFFSDTTRNVGGISYDHSTDKLGFQVASSMRLFIDSTGNVGISTETPTEKLTVDGNITASGDVTSTSDVRVKTDITPITGALDIINKLEGKRFNKFDKPGIGFIAQELEQYMPELVHTANDEAGTKSVNYANMVALLVEAIKEQQITINKLESKLNGN